MFDISHLKLSFEPVANKILLSPVSNLPAIPLFITLPSDNVCNLNGVLNVSVLKSCPPPKLFEVTAPIETVASKPHVPSIFTYFFDGRSFF